MSTRSFFLGKINAEILCLESELSKYMRYLGTDMNNFGALETFFNNYFGKYAGMYFYGQDMQLKVVEGMMPVGYNVGVKHLVVRPFVPYEKACFHPEFFHDEVPEQMGCLLTDDSRLIGEFKTDADLLVLISRLYPLEIVERSYSGIEREMRAKEEQKKQEWNKVVESKKEAARSTGFTFAGGKMIDSMDALKSFFNWFNFYAYDKINVFGSSESNKGFIFEYGAYSIVIRGFCITVKYQYTYLGRVTVSKTIEMYKLGFRTTDIANTSYNTQSDLYSCLLAYIGQAWSMSR